MARDAADQRNDRSVVEQPSRTSHQNDMGIERDARNGARPLADYFDQVMGIKTSLGAVGYRFSFFFPFWYAT